MNNIYEQKSLTKLIFIFGVPSTISLMIEMLTGIVDTAFAGNLAQIGDSALSAMALISPVLGIFTALQTLFAMSTGILIAKYLNNRERQLNSYTCGVVMSVVMSAGSSLLCAFTLTRVLTALGAQGQILLLAKQYMQVQLVSNVFSSLGYTLTSCIRAFGYPKIEVAVISASVAVNIVFNFIFAFVFKLGITGLALGTLVSESTCALFSVGFLIKKKLWLHKGPMSVHTFLHSAWELFKIGAAQTAIQMLGGCTGFVINARLLYLGTMAHVAAWSVAQRIYTFILMPIVGLTQGVQNIISYFSGIGANDKIKKVSGLTTLLCTGYGIFALILMMLFGQNLAAAFGGNPQIIDIAHNVLYIVFMGFPFIGVLYTDVTLLQVTEHELASVLLILSRQVFFLIPLVFIVPWLITALGLELPAVISLFLCMPVADVMSVIFAFGVKKKLADK